jgi:hypothetical protein
MLFFAAAPTLRLGSVTYTYTGNDFTSVNSPYYTTSDFISVSLTFASALRTPCRTTETANLTSWMVSDGILTIDSVNTSGASFSLGTDAGGAIDEWVISAYELVNNSISTKFQSPTFEEGTFNPMGYEQAGGETAPGSWQETSSAPEPSTTIIVSLAVATLLIGRKRRYRTQPSRY